MSLMSRRPFALNINPKEVVAGLKISSRPTRYAPHVDAEVLGVQELPGVGNPRAEITVKLVGSGEEFVVKSKRALIREWVRRIPRK